VPNNFPTKIIPGGYYAVLPYSGPAGNTARHWAWLCRSWLPRSEYQISLHSCYERFPGGLPEIGAQVQSELYLPLRK
jgi:DNA gyrase inhibitor GyrI